MEPPEHTHVMKSIFKETKISNNLETETLEEILLQQSEHGENQARTPNRSNQNWALPKVHKRKQNKHLGFGFPQRAI